MAKMKRLAQKNEQVVVPQQRERHTTQCIGMKTNKLSIQNKAKTQINLNVIIESHPLRRKQNKTRSNDSKF